MKSHIKTLHWPSSYPEPERGNPYNCIFVEEHVKAVQDYCQNRVLYISSEDVSNGKWYQRIDREENGIPVTRFYFNKKLNKYFLNVLIRFVLTFYFLDLLFVKRFRPDVIHVHLYQSTIWAKLYAKMLNCPIVITEHWSAFLGWGKLETKRYAEAANAFRSASHVLPVSHKIINGIENHTNTTISHKSTVIRNAVDTRIFNYRPGNPSNDIIFVGRNAQVKDIPTLLQAFAIVSGLSPGTRLHLVGEGDYYDLEALVKELNIEKNVVLYGGLSKQEISSIMQECKLLVLSSHMENSPCVIGEAHCCGLPVVATNVGGVTELILEGEVVDPGKHELLSQKILESLRKNHDRERLAQTASDHFSYQAVGADMYKVYKRITRL